jgi:hypothetical protein
LSDWIVEAIDRGEYEPNQVQKLVEQKIGVKRAIFAQARHESPASSRSSDDLSKDSTTAGYSTFSTLPTTLDEELHTADQDMNHDGLLGTGSRTESAPRTTIQLDTCNWKVTYDSDDMLFRIKSCLVLSFLPSNLSRARVADPRQSRQRALRESSSMGAREQTCVGRASAGQNRAYPTSRYL